MLDCLIIGGGPAGLAAAIYLARFRRSVIVVDAGHSRALRIPCARNHAGFPDGIKGRELLDRMRDQAAKYGAGIQQASIASLAGGMTQGFRAEGNAGDIAARTVLLATGIANREPELADIGKAVDMGALRYCPICDGYEAKDHTIGVLGHGSSGLKEALFLTTYSRDITLMSYKSPLALDDAESWMLEQAGVRTFGPVASLRLQDGRIVCASDEGERAFQSLYPAFGCDANSALAVGVGAKLDVAGCIVADKHQSSSVEGIYAAGDVVSSADQISIAMGHAAVSAIAIHNRLREAA